MTDKREIDSNRLIDFINNFISDKFINKLIVLNNFGIKSYFENKINYTKYYILFFRFFFVFLICF